MSYQGQAVLDREKITHWIEAYGQAWRDRDAAAAAALFTQDAVYASSPGRVPHQGRDAIHAYLQRASSTQRDLDLRFGQQIVAGLRAAVEWWATMRDIDAPPPAAADVSSPHRESGAAVPLFRDEAGAAVPPLRGEDVPAPSRRSEKPRGGDWVTLPGCLLLRFTSQGLCAELREYWTALPGQRIGPLASWGT